MFRAEPSVLPLRSLTTTRQCELSERLHTTSVHNLCTGSCREILVARDMRTALFGYMETDRAEPEQQGSAPVASSRTSPERLTLTVDEVAAALGISRSSAYECARRGEIPTVRFGRRIVVPRRAVLALLGETDTEP